MLGNIGMDSNRILGKEPGASVCEGVHFLLSVSTFWGQSLFSVV